MFVSSVTERGATPALTKTLAFNEARLRTIAENVANADVVGYRAKQLDARGFQRTLREAMNERGDDPAKPFVLRDNGEVSTDADGMLKVTPRETPVDNLLFHDGTNVSMEREMADLAETQMAHQAAAFLLRSSFERMRTAIRGRV